MRNAFSYYQSRVLPFILVFLGVESAMRLVFLIREHQKIGQQPLEMLATLALGALYDIAVLAYFLLPLLLLLLLKPRRLQRHPVGRILLIAAMALFTFMILLSAVSEWFFWEEFTTRFNFIAVDYLVYTHEVIGNIRESYSVTPVLVALAVISLMVAWSYGRYLNRRPMEVPRTRQRSAMLIGSIALACISFTCITGQWASFNNNYLGETAKNGIFELFSAFRNNELPYHKFYLTQDEAKSLPQLQAALGVTQVNPASPLTRHIQAEGPEKHYNIVLFTVESLSADYLGAFGNKQHLTPHLDALAKQSLLFTNLYATGTRTVYGLSAITLSTPPIPGNSIVRRPENEGLFSLGSVLNSKGYVSKFIYGGYGYFDNMNKFFVGNGYQIVDRTNMADDEIGFANIWGVADEYLFTRILKENDDAHAKGKPFFDMVMTTSNHRPFTYPDGRINIRSHTGREGGVKYTDYAIHQFLQEAKKHPWFDNTIFVIIADHTAGAAGKIELDPQGYHIPLMIYALGIIKPGVVDTFSSQIDVAPTLLGLLNMSYDSRFYGQDLLKSHQQRAFISNYQRLGYLTPEELVVLKPIRKADYFKKEDDDYVAQKKLDPQLLEKAIAYFQSATHWKEWNRKQ